MIFWTFAFLVWSYHLQKAFSSPFAAENTVSEYSLRLGISGWYIIACWSISVFHIAISARIRLSRHDFVLLAPSHKTPLLGSFPFAFEKGFIIFGTLLSCHYYVNEGIHGPVRDDLRD